MKKTLLWCLKVFVSGFLAFCFLTAFCMLYYNIPAHTESVSKATDHSWEHNKFYSRATEGFGWGKTNNEGYLNPYDYSKDDTIDILTMGSSHMEGFNVAYDKSTSAVLGALLPDYTVYNIGVSDHSFLTCVDNLEAAIEKYKPTKYVVIETTKLTYKDEKLTEAIDGTVAEVGSGTSGIVGTLERIPLLRLLYSQMASYMRNTSTTTTSSNAPATTINEDLYNELFVKMSSTVAKSGAKLIIVYHSNLKINEDGSASILKDESDVSVLFEDMCNKNGILFLDMSDIFIKEYEENHVLPHGFANSSVGSGHLNNNGHKMIANAVYELVKEEK